jgi:hypothetical protein
VCIFHVIWLASIVKNQAAGSVFLEAGFQEKDSNNDIDIDVQSNLNHGSPGLH